MPNSSAVHILHSYNNVLHMNGCLKSGIRHVSFPQYPSALTPLWNNPMFYIGKKAFSFPQWKERGVASLGHLLHVTNWKIRATALPNPVPSTCESNRQYETTLSSTAFIVPAHLLTKNGICSIQLNRYQSHIKSLLADTLPPASFWWDGNYSWRTASQLLNVQK